VIGIKYNYGCYLHDRHYRDERKKRLTRKGADQLLRKEVFKAFKGRGILKYIFGYFWAWSMYVGVRIGARRHYKTA